MTYAAFALVLSSVVLFVAGVLLVPFKRQRSKGRRCAIVGLVGTVVGIAWFGLALNQEAIAKGFLNMLDQQRAKELGFTDPIAWSAQRAELDAAEAAAAANRAAEEATATAARREREAAENALREAQQAAAAEQRQAQAEAERAEREASERAAAEEERAAAEAERLAHVEQCQADLQCLGDEFSTEASVACGPRVERLAVNDYEWTNGFLEPKFSRFRWADREAGVITYIGDKIRYQNGFGAWTRFQRNALQNSSPARSPTGLLELRVTPRLRNSSETAACRPAAPAASGSQGRSRLLRFIKSGS